MLLSKEKLYLALNTALSTGADFAEVFVEKSLNKTISMISRGGSCNIDSVIDRTISGIGIRAYKGLRSAHSSTSDFSFDGIKRCAQSVADSISDTSRMLMDLELLERVNSNIHKIDIVPSSVRNITKVDLLKSAISAATNKDSKITQVMGT